VAVRELGRPKELGEYLVKVTKRTPLGLWTGESTARRLYGWNSQRKDPKIWGRAKLARPNAP
jgi:hypothetical protein